MSHKSNNSRIHNFSVILPHRGVKDSDSDLRLSLVSLKNSQAAIAVHIARIEKELADRGVSRYIIHPDRELA
ncbi:MAG: hypothetical protein OEV85_08085 [Candidatus Thorarchaeota archaeon]|nr:hypothetical protein [Candidatus Thorarchaeota archaeon]